MDMESLSTVNGNISDGNSGSSLLMNGTYSTGEVMNLNGDAHTGSMPEPTQPKEDGVNYADAFPPLPAVPASGKSIGQSAWGSSRPTKAKQQIKQQAANKPILSSNSSQVFKIPFEERKYKNLSPIVGDGDRQNNSILDVMQKTGTKIEVTVTKDQSLTVMISGKRENAAQARRLIVAGLQSQASIEMVIPKDHHRFILGKGGKKTTRLGIINSYKNYHTP